jgi:hypothetical protein
MRGKPFSEKADRSYLGVKSSLFGRLINRQGKQNQNRRLSCLITVYQRTFLEKILKKSTDRKRSFFQHPARKELDEIHTKFGSPADYRGNDFTDMTDWVLG